MERVSFYRHSLDRTHAAAVADVIGSDFLTSGRVGRGVEALLAEYFDVPSVALTNSWTNGALAALVAIGLQPGDEVIVPAMTFVACANVVEVLGGRAVLVDVDPDTLLIDFEAAADAVGPRTRAVMPTHLYGQMCDVRALRRRLDAVRPGILVIEDCAHAFEARFDGERPGQHGDLAVFSFYATKNVTCGEGGAVLARDPALMARIRPALLHGMSAGAADRFAGGMYRHWDVERLGVKANLPDLLAALLPRQIAGIDALLPGREAMVGRYRDGLDRRLRFAEVDPRATSAHHLFPVHVPGGRRDAVLARLNAAGVDTTVNYRSIHHLTYYRDKYAIPDYALPVSASWGEGQISLPLDPGLGDDRQDRVIAAVNAAVAAEA